MHTAVKPGLGAHARQALAVAAAVLFGVCIGWASTMTPQAGERHSAAHRTSQGVSGSSSVSSSSSSSSSSSAPLLALMVVPTMPGDFQLRLLHRSTWMQHAKQLPFVRAVFVTGTSSDPLLQLEGRRYGDIVSVPAKEQGDLVNKTGATLQWAARQAPPFQFLVKVDTDTFAHPFNIAAYLTRLGTTTGVYIGLDCPQQHCFQSPGFSFMQGGLYILSADLVQALASWLEGPHQLPDTPVAKRAAHPWYEDYYVGLLLDHVAPRHMHYKAGNATFAHPYDGSVGHPKWWFDSVMGVHALKNAAHFARCYQHYAPGFASTQACYTSVAQQPPQQQIAACGSRRLPPIPATPA